MSKFAKLPSGMRGGPSLPEEPAKPVTLPSDPDYVHETVPQEPWLAETLTGPDIAAEFQKLRDAATRGVYTDAITFLREGMPVPEVVAIVGMRRFGEYDISAEKIETAVKAAADLIQKQKEAQEKS